MMNLTLFFFILTLVETITNVPQPYYLILFPIAIDER